MVAKVKAVLAAVAMVVAETAGAAAVHNIEGLEIARRMAASGATELALQRVNLAQPLEPSAPQWVDWELLRLELLWRRGRDVEVLKRAAAARGLTLSDRAAAQFSLTAARSAQRLGENLQARAFYAMYFAHSHALTTEYRDARLAVISVYVQEGNAEDAYRSMLRFQQDFSPLRSEETERFVAALVTAGRAAEAVIWLPQLDKASPSAAMLRLRAGLITPEAAIAQARVLLAKGGGESALNLLALAAATQKNRAVEIEALEQRLHLAPPEPRATLVRNAGGLWSMYAEVGQQIANQAQLLVGDDPAWIERAIRILPQQPHLARSLLGYLAAASKNEEARIRAQQQLIASLREAKLSLVALRLFSDQQGFPIVGLHPSVRMELGTLAATQKHAAEAVRFWQGLPPPPGAGGSEWRLRYVAALFAAGMVDDGLEAAKLATAGAAPELVSRLITIAFDTLDAWQVKAAESLFALLLPLTNGGERVNVLLGLGKARELRGEFRAAAEAYFTAAAMYAPEAERESLRARESGASNLAKAGMLDDARAAYQWLAANAKDPVVRDNAARALKNL